MNSETDNPHSSTPTGATGEAKRFLGVDVGTRRIGIAISDDDGGFALPHATFEAHEATARIGELVLERGTEVIVVGWPLELDGREGRATRNVERFVERLERALADLVEAGTIAAVPDIVLYDERLTTSAAQNLLGEAAVYGKKRKAVVDQVAATQILQNYLDENR